MTRRTFEIAAFCAAVLIAALAIHAWLSSRDEQHRLQTILAIQKKVLDAADARERTRQATLNDALAKIEKLKRVTQTPQQIIRELPEYLPLPQPITLAPSATNTNAQQGTALSAKSEAPPQPSPRNLQGPPVESPAPPQSAVPCNPDGNCIAQIPTVDLKPLYDFTQNCRACQLRLTAAQQDHADDIAKLAAVTRERDAAITAVKGGTIWRRLHRDSLWFVVGVGVGAAAAHIAAHR
jgi:hypothetical protein